MAQSAIQLRPTALSEIVVEPVVKLVYGPTGCGKTVYCTNSQYLRTLLIDVDRGKLSAQCNIGNQVTGLKPTRLDLVQAWTCNTFDDVIRAYEWAASHIKDYDLISLDTATELQRMTLSLLCEEAKIQVPSKREWGIALSMMDDLIRSFKDLGVHIIWTAHERSFFDEETGQVKFKPAFQGQFIDYYARHFSNIMRYAMSRTQVPNAAGQLEEQVTRALMCQANPFADGKDRSSALDLWELPDLDTIMGKITNRVMQARDQNNAPAT